MKCPPVHSYLNRGISWEDWKFIHGVHRKGACSNIRRIMYREATRITLYIVSIIRVSLIRAYL
jgi:hypothetical protein